MLDFNNIKLNKNIDFKIEEISQWDIAIIGMSGKFPMAENIDELWENIRNGKDCISSFPDARREDTDNYLYCTDHCEEDISYYEGGYLNDIDKFDYKFFRLSPKEANLMSPSQRLFLETAWSAIENGGYGGNKLLGTKTGVYVGYEADAPYDYKKFILDMEPTAMSNAVVGNLTPIIASRISYLLDLKGPSMSIDTACSSSLVAIHLACQALRTKECEMAIAGSVRVNLLPINKSKLNIGTESADARARTFDDNSDGTGSGEGVAAIILKPLNRALEDKDQIYAVIKGSAVNQDGKSIGITAPNPAAQEEVILSAWKDANINPESITYIEAHGTGTRLGDPIEIEGVSRAFRNYTNKKQFCAIGSIKTNIGHLDCAAGIAGLIKSVMSLKHKEIPPSLHFLKPNKNIGFTRSPVYVNDSLQDWKAGNYPRRCGVSSFGFAGTNCHLILEEAPEVKEQYKENTSRPNIFVLSAKCEESLRLQLKEYMKYVCLNSNLELEQICYTASTSRGHYNHRIAMVIKDEEDFRAKIRTLCNYCVNLNDQSIVDKGIYYGEHKLISEDNAWETKGLTDSELKNFSDLAKKEVELLSQTGSCKEKIARNICKLYVRGANIEWERLYEGEKIIKVSIPTYSFARTRCWLNTNSEVCRKVHLKASNIANTTKTMNSISSYYNTAWIPDKIDKEGDILNVGLTLIIRANEEFSERIYFQLLEKGVQAIDVVIGDEYRKISNNQFIISDTKNDFLRLMGEIRKNELVRVIHLLSLSNDNEISRLDQLEKSQERGVYSLFYISQILLNSGIKNEIDIILISKYVNEINGREDYLKPENATLFGLGKVISQEYHSLKCRCIDIDKYVSSKEIISELGAKNKQYIVAYRNEERFIEEFRIASLDDCPVSKLSISENGVYIISGGTGGIGLEIAKFLSKQSKVKLPLINRSKMPPREKWDDIVLRGEDTKLINKINSIREIEAGGSEVIFYNADISVEKEVQACIKSVKERFGKINGVIHSGGIAGDGFILTKSIETFRNVLLPKVHGTWILDHLTKEEKLDFFIMFSSVGSIFGGVGQSDYTAANCYLDSFEAYRSKRGMKTLTINWTAWKETGMAKDYGVNVDGAFRVLTTAQGISAFSEVIYKDVRRIIVGEINYDSELLDSGYLVPIKLSNDVISKIAKERNKLIKIKEQKKEESSSVKLLGRNDDNYSQIERNIAQMCAENLGLFEISIYDNFYELGADSIISTKIINDINKKMGIKTEMPDLLNNPTIESFSSFLQREYIHAIDDINLYSSIQHVRDRDYYPVSSAQKRLYVIDQIEDAGSSYNIPVVMFLEGKIDINRFKEVFSQIISRHESLRTSFEIIEGEIVQRVHKAVPLNISIHKHQYKDLDSYVRGFIRPFDIKKPPLLRIELIKQKNDKYVLLFDIHHIISDGVSANIIINEFLILYNGGQLENLKIQYRDYAIWQNKLLNSEVIKKQENFWLDRFSGEIPTLNMPIDFPRPAVKSFNGKMISFHISKELTRGLKKLGHETSSTMYMVVLAVYNVLLFKYTGQKDIIVGSPISGRSSADMENIVGIFINTLAMRNYPEGFKTFKEFLFEVRDNALKAYANQDYQFEMLVERLGVSKDRSRSALFDTMLIMQNVEYPQMQMGDLKLTPYKIMFDASKFDLKLEVFDKGETVFCTIDYCTSLFKEETILKFKDDLIHIADVIAASPDIMLQDISLVPEQEKINIVHEFNSNLDEE